MKFFVLLINLILQASQKPQTVPELKAQLTTLKNLERKLD